MASSRCSHLAGSSSVLIMFPSQKSTSVFPARPPCMMLMQAAKLCRGHRSWKLALLACSTVGNTEKEKQVAGVPDTCWDSAEYGSRPKKWVTKNGKCESVVPEAPPAGAHQDAYVLHSVSRDLACQVPRISQLHWKLPTPIGDATSVMESQPLQ